MKTLTTRQIERRNFVLNFVEGAIFSSSSAFFSSQTVLPALVKKLGGDSIAVGSIGVITYVGLFLPQIFAARYVETHPWKKPWSIKYGIIQRVVVLALATSLLVFGESNPTIALSLLLLLFALNQIMLGITTPGWFEMFAKMVSVNRRGRLTGIRSSLGGIGAFLGGIVLTWFLARFAFPLSYALALYAAFALQTVSIIIQTYLIEEKPSIVRQRKDFFSYMRQMPHLLRTNIPFRNFLLATIVQIIATMPIGFYAVYALQRFSANETMVGAFTLAIVAVQVVSSFGMGYLADHRGNKLALIIAAGALFLANVWAMFAPSLEWFMLVFILFGINIGTELLARYNIAIEYGPPEQRALYIGVMNTLVAPFYLVSLVGGALIESFGYMSVFGVGISASIVGMALMTFTVLEPRSIKLHSQ